MKTILFMIIGLSSFIWADFTRLNGVVTDNTTGLEWQDEYSATNRGIIKSGTWEHSIDYCESLSLDGRNWRLPNKKELQSILDRSKYNPAIDTNTFIKTQTNYYWSSTTSLNRHNEAWVIKFSHGVFARSGKLGHHHVRCVR